MKRKLLFSAVLWPLPRPGIFGGPIPRGIFSGEETGDGAGGVGWGLELLSSVSSDDIDIG